MAAKRRNDEHRRVERWTALNYASHYPFSRSKARSQQQAPSHTTKITNQVCCCCCCATTKRRALVSVPDEFGFVYTQTVLILVFSSYELLRKDKDFTYDLAAVIVTLPIGFVAWVEAFGCDFALRDIGGHIWYDNTIALSLLVYYVIIERRDRKKNNFESREIESFWPLPSRGTLSHLAGCTY